MRAGSFPISCLRGGDAPQSQTVDPESQIAHLVLPSLTRAFSMTVILKLKTTLPKIGFGLHFRISAGWGIVMGACPS